MTVISVDGSGPPEGWRQRVLEHLLDDLDAAGKTDLDWHWITHASDRELIKAAIRVGRLPRSVIATMPPKPEELQQQP